MKKSILISLILFTTVLFPQTGWFWQNPLPQGLTLYEVKSLSANEFVALGSSGSIIKSTDGGVNWFQIYGAIETHLKSLAIVNEIVWFALGLDPFFIPNEDGYLVILKTVDGGNSWTKYTTGIYYDDWADMEIDFANADYGTVVAQSHRLLTTNGGSSWQEYSSYPGMDIKFTSGGVGLIAGDGNIYRTADYGVNWTEHTTPPATLLSVFFSNPGTAYAAGEGGTIIKSIDGGINWTSQTSGVTANLQSVFFTSDNNGVIVGDDGIILRTSNGGTTWSQETSPTTIQLYSISFGNASTAVAVGKSGVIINSINGGISWTVQNKSVTSNPLNAVFFTDASTGTIVGTSGTILRTTNGGNSWVTQNGNTTVDLNDVFFVNSTLGFIVGENGLILKTTNGGTNWTVKTSGTTEDLNDIYFINSSKGYIAGAGRILHTINGGESWNSTAISTDLYSVYFLDENNGWAAGGAEVFKTINGGVNWVSIYTQWPDRFYEIYFGDMNSGVLIGENSFGSGILKRTTDGGANWNASVSGSSSQSALTDMSFSDADNGVVVGYGCNSCSRGIIERTTDGGANWSLQYSNTEVDLTAIALPDPLNGVAVGSTYPYQGSGVILRTNNGGIPVELIFFSAAVTGKEAVLNWQTATELNNKGFEIERKLSNEEWVTRSFVKGNGTTTERKEYTFKEELTVSGTYIYRLKQIDFDGSFAYSTEAEILFNDIPDSYQLFPSYPNPFNPITKIKFSLPVEQTVEIKIFDVLGNEIEVLMKENLPPGTYERQWNGNNFSSGIYYYRLKAGEFSKTMKMVLMK